MLTLEQTWKPPPISRHCQLLRTIWGWVSKFGMPALVLKVHKFTSFDKRAGGGYGAPQQGVGQSVLTPGSITHPDSDPAISMRVCIHTSLAND